MTMLSTQFAQDLGTALQTTSSRFQVQLNNDSTITVLILPADQSNASTPFQVSVQMEQQVRDPTSNFSKSATGRNVDHFYFVREFVTTEVAAFKRNRFFLSMLFAH